MKALKNKVPNCDKCRVVPIPENYEVMGIIEKYNSILMDSSTGSLNGNNISFVFKLENIISNQRILTLKIILWFDIIKQLRDKANGKTY